MGTLFALPYSQASRIAFAVDKTIATHTNLTISKPYKHKVGIYQWWGAIAIIFTAFQICEICYKKIISITPFVNMSFQQLNSLSSWNWYKDNERYFILQLNVSVKMRVESYFYSEYP